MCSVPRSAGREGPWGFPDTVCGEKSRSEMGAGRVVAERHPGGVAGPVPWAQAEDKRVLSKPLADVGLEHKTSDSQALPSVDLAVTRGGCRGEGAEAEGRGRTPERRLKSLGLYGLQVLPERVELALCNPQSTPTPAQQPPAGTLFSAARPHCHGRLLQGVCNPSSLRPSLALARREPWHPRRAQCPGVQSRG